MKELNQYSLHTTIFGKISCDTITIHHGSKFFTVAAVSIQQAYYYAGNDVWFDEDCTGGILEQSYHTSRDTPEKWLDWEGKESNFKSWPREGAKKMLKRYIAQIKKKYSTQLNNTKTKN